MKYTKQARMIYSCHFIGWNTDFYNLVFNTNKIFLPPANYLDASMHVNAISNLLFIQFTAANTANS